jgi:Sugar (and other) transporter.
LACITVPWLAIWAGNWRTFILMITIPNIIVPSFYFFVPESASWLLSKGKVKKALRCFKRVAKYNGKELTPQVIQNFEVSLSLYAKPASPSYNQFVLQCPDHVVTRFKVLYSGFVHIFNNAKKHCHFI